MPFDANGELKLEGVPPIPSDAERVRKVAERLELQQVTQGSGPVLLWGFEAGAVLNVLIGKTPPIQPNEGVHDHRDEWEKGPA